MLANSEKPIIYFDPLVWKKIWHFVYVSPVEVSGLGIVETINGRLTVTDVFVPKQTNSSTSTEMDPDDLNKFNFIHREKNIRFWWHSHVNMNVFWSGDDMAAMRKLGKGSYVLSTVFNKKGEHRSAVYMEKPVPLFWDEVAVKIAEQPVDPALIAEWDQTFKDKCSQATFPTYEYEEQPLLQNWEKPRQFPATTQAKPLTQSPEGFYSKEPLTPEIEDEIEQMVEYYLDQEIPEHQIRKHIRDDYGYRGLKYYLEIQELWAMPPEEEVTNVNPQ